MKTAKNLACIVLAAGLGKRMKSKKIKVLHELRGKPLIFYTIETLTKLSPEILVVVVGYQREDVKKALSDFDIKYAIQEEQLGTGHAALQAENILKNFKGNILIMPGDVPIIKLNTLQLLIDTHIAKNHLLTVLTVDIDNASGYGRIIKDIDGKILKIVEEKDASSDELNIKCVNSGIYVVDSSFLWDACKKLNNNNKQNEFYLTDIVCMAKEKDSVGSFHLDSPLEALGVNTKEDLKKLEKILNKKIPFLSPFKKGG